MENHSFPIIFLNNPQSTGLKELHYFCPKNQKIVQKSEAGKK